MSSHHPRLLGAVTLGLLAVGLAGLTQSVYAQKSKHVVIRKALRETHRAHELVGGLKPIYGGHRKAALEHMEAATKEMHAAMKFAGLEREKFGTVQKYQVEKKDKHYVIRRAERELRAAHKEMKGLKPIYDGHRARAMEHLEKSIGELEKAGKFVESR